MTAGPSYAYPSRVTRDRNIFLATENQLKSGLHALVMRYALVDDPIPDGWHAAEIDGWHGFAGRVIHYKEGYDDRNKEAARQTTDRRT